LCGCGSSEKTTVENVTVNVSPLSVNVALGATQQFAATVRGTGKKHKRQRPKYKYNI
jgi:hypothetical protein